MISLLLCSNANAQPNQSSFDQLYHLGNGAEKVENWSLAFKYHAQACRLETPEHLDEMRIDACESTIKHGWRLDRWASAYAHFDALCGQGSDLGCFFLAKAAANRGNRSEAIEIMGDLCDKGFNRPAVDGYEACANLELLTQRMEARDTIPENAMGFGKFVVLSLITLAVVSFILLKKHLVRAFLKNWARLVAIPFAIFGLALVARSFISGIVFFLSWFYFHPPAMLIGEPYFYAGTGMGARGAMAMCSVAMFYTFISALVTLAREAVRKPQNPRRERSPITRPAHSLPPPGDL